jgi:predicted metal-dependent phosphoesterase TrpH
MPDFPGKGRVAVHQVTNPKSMLRLELHCHTIYSKDSLLSPTKLLLACQRKSIDRVAITDHNTITGAIHAHKLDPERVIIGEEIMTTQGELLAFFVQEEVPAGLSPQDAINRLRDQGAFIDVSHPFDRFRGGSWETADLMEILPSVDAIETFNSRCISSSGNQTAQDFARQHSILSTVGSDAHTVYEIGKATLILGEFQDAESLKTALPTAQSRVTLSGPWVHLASRYAVFYKKYFFS